VCTSPALIDDWIIHHKPSSPNITGPRCQYQDYTKTPIEANVLLFSLVIGLVEVVEIKTSLLFLYYV
jgi:hypothetical protein